MSDKNQPPKPTGLKTETPPESNAPDRAGFVYQADPKEPTLDETHPVAASLLHVFVMTFLGVIAFVIGALYCLLRGKRGPSPGWAIVLMIFGGLAGLSYFLKLCKRDH